MEKISDNEILNGVLDEFEKLTKIPRPSKHEEKISAFLQKYLSDLNFKVERDKNNNIIAEISASVGKENAPMTILQAHMDMVCVAKENYKYDPLNDPIKIIRTEKFLQAEGTSLGADDGIGIAEILYIVKNFQHGKFEKIPHGALRIIFTTDEEQGMSGAIGLDEKFLRDANFFINCDSENCNEIVVGSAGSMHVDFTRKINFVQLDGDLKNPFKIKISGLRGGHSGTEIHEGRANAVKILAQFLQLVRNYAKVQLVNFSGGTAFNVIPSSAEAIIVTDCDFEKISELSKKFSDEFTKIYGDAENLALEIFHENENLTASKKVWSDRDFNDFMNLLLILHSGVYAMSREIPTQVETSANIGVVKIIDDEVQISLLPRSNITENLYNLREMFRAAANATNFDIKTSDPSPAWNYNPESRLEKIMSKIFEEQNNFPAQIKTIHAGLECSFFLEKNPKLDIVSVGTTNENIHSPNEKLHLDTVAPQVKMIVATLKQISELKGN